MNIQISGYLLLVLCGLALPVQSVVSTIKYMIFLEKIQHIDLD